MASDTPLDAAEPGEPRDQLYSLRTETHRFILCPNGEMELYDHRTDPGERRNLAGDADQQERVAELKALIEETLAAVE